MARDRKRSKQRRARQRTPAGRRQPYGDAAAAFGASAPRASGPDAEPVVDEELEPEPVVEAEPEPVVEEELELELEPVVVDEAIAATDGAAALTDPVLDAELDAEEEELDDEDALAPGVRRAPARKAARPSGNRVIAFLQASWAELQRVQWPDRREVAQATAVVMGFVVIAGAFLGLADFISQKIVNAIL